MQISAIVARISLTWPIATCRNIAFITIKRCDVLLFRIYVLVLSIASSLPSILYIRKIPRGGDDDDDDAGDSSHSVSIVPNTSPRKFSSDQRLTHTVKFFRCRRTKIRNLIVHKHSVFFYFKIILSLNTIGVTNGSGQQFTPKSKKLIFYFSPKFKVNR